MTDNVRYIRDYKRREEREAADVRLAKQAHDSSAYTAGLRGLNYADTAPCEMPPVQPSYQAPEQDPA
ncbi:hypothetical protein [Bradyrhizobium sp. LVM 105]|uniref:hypothetical protein n=1 Tax=Bradyrhizobium sp. LVM 105 TaxID=2341115 RepID=UPI000F8095A9|nr:hypothetical protein [Bradyrhizobium sp. LVM 105]RTE91896.1 hypothetical protein D6B98_15890 [Bradyrhizobium sp. LVM 105]